MPMLMQEQLPWSSQRGSRGAVPPAPVALVCRMPVALLLLATLIAPTLVALAPFAAPAPLALESSCWRGEVLDSLLQALMARKELPRAVSATHVLALLREGSQVMVVYLV